MGLFKDIVKDFLCPGWDEREEGRPLEKREPEIKVTVSEDSGEGSYEDFMANLKEKRKEESGPKIVRVDARDKFYSYEGAEFDWSDIPVNQFAGGAWYLLDGSNADKILKDISDLDVFAYQADRIATVPDFRFPMEDILLKPEWIEKKYESQWVYSRITPEPLTKTGKPPKYPISVRLISRSGNYEARLKYNQQDKIGNAEISVGELGRSWHTMAVRDGKIIRIIKHEGFENFPVYSET